MVNGVVVCGLKELFRAVPPWAEENQPLNTKPVFVGAGGMLTGTSKVYEPLATGDPPCVSKVMTYVFGVHCEYKVKLDVV
jgi:hypothetical protein